MDRLTSLAVFVAAVDEGSIAAAGRRFGLSPVMAGRYLSALEDHVGVRLVERTTRQLNLTDAGRAYFAKAKRILDDLQEADHEAADLQATPRGSLRIAAPITFGSLYLGPVVAAYMAEFAQVEVSLHLQDRFVDLIEEGMDLALRIGQLPDSNLVARKLADCQLLACAAPSWLAAAGVPTHPEDLARHQLIGYLGEVTTAPWSFTSPQGQTFNLDYPCRFSANNTAVMLAVALAGGGIVYGPDFVFARHLQTGQLQRVLPDYRSPVLPLHAVTPTARYVNTKTRLFIERLKGAFAGASPWLGKTEQAEAKIRKT
ncbi:LysR family transcriptional regulator [Amantichitinum ursilacus]|uniref:HTH-type transcriptional regulator DmlR n=1 Tax=Amantichitinum ursilacus TaxID=857265 RepID=A0A0N0GPZ6_9NEIS|nr:LysR family transcriptional regulator [Amantichitinum ursilacus]KPC54182.1 HTH-type transcriptional regulator DmlR [Amantichitinum ursilacus]